MHNTYILCVIYFTLILQSTGSVVVNDYHKNLWERFNGFDLKLWECSFCTRIIFDDQPICQTCGNPKIRTFLGEVCKMNEL